MPLCDLEFLLRALFIVCHTQIKHQAVSGFCVFVLSFVFTVYSSLQFTCHMSHVTCARALLVQQLLVLALLFLYLFYTEDRVGFFIQSSSCPNIILNTPIALQSSIFNSNPQYPEFISRRTPRLALGAWHLAL
jgi:hypothetical protein